MSRPLRPQDVDWKSALNQHLQERTRPHSQVGGRSGSTHTYTHALTGPPNDRTFVATCTIDVLGGQRFQGKPARTKRASEHAAARVALNAIGGARGVMKG